MQLRCCTIQKFFLKWNLYFVGFPKSPSHWVASWIAWPLLFSPRSASRVGYFGKLSQFNTKELLTIIQSSTNNYLLCLDISLWPRCFRLLKLSRWRLLYFCCHNIFQIYFISTYLATPRWNGSFKPQTGIWILIYKRLQCNTPSPTNDIYFV